MSLACGHEGLPSGPDFLPHGDALAGFGFQICACQACWIRVVLLANLEPTREWAGVLRCAETALRLLKCLGSDKPRVSANIHPYRRRPLAGSWLSSRGLAKGNKGRACFRIAQVCCNDRRQSLRKRPRPIGHRSRGWEGRGSRGTSEFLVGLHQMHRGSRCP